VVVEAAQGKPGCSCGNKTQGAGEAAAEGNVAYIVI